MYSQIRLPEPYFIDLSVIKDNLLGLRTNV